MSTSFKAISSLISSVIYTGLGFIITTLLAKNMSSNEFGLLRLVIDTSTIAFPLILLGFQNTWTQSIAVAVESTDQSNLKGVVIFLVTICCILTILATKLLLQFVIPALDFDVGKYSIFISYSFVICVPLFRDMTEGVLIAQGKVFASAISIVMPQLVILVIILFLAKPIDLFSITLVQTLIIVISSYGSIIITGVSFVTFKKSLKLLIRNNRYFGFPIYLSGGIVLIGRNALQLLTGACLDNTEYGNLSLSIMLSGVLGFIPSAISKAKFQDFARFPDIGKVIFFWCLITMTVGGGLMFIGSYLYILLLGKDYMLIIYSLPFLILSTIFHGIGDIINRFFLAKGNAFVLSKISIIIGIVSTVSGIFLVKMFGFWGVLAEKLFTSIFFLFLYSTEYIRFTKHKS